MPSEPTPLPTVMPSADGASLDVADAVENPGSPVSADHPSASARKLLDRQAEAHRSALTEALEEARGALRSLRSRGNGQAGRVARELGALASGPLDPERFAALLERDPGMDPEHLEIFEKAVSILEWATDESARVAEVSVEDAETLAQAVERVLRHRGRAFGAVRVLALLRSGEFQAGEHASLLEGIPFRDWRTVERQVAPPLIVTTPGHRLDTLAALAPLMDGGMKILLLAEGPTPPAPLARLIAPGILVAQAHDPGVLGRIGAFPGPAVAALVPESCAAFIHDPGTEVADGDAAPVLRILSLPDSTPRSWVGGMSPGQQARDLELLRAWSRAPDGPPGSSVAAPEGGSKDDEAKERDPTIEPAERLAAWLLSQAELDDSSRA
jgi:hypothetical protein